MDALDDLMRVLIAGARGAEGLRTDDSFTLVLVKGSGNSWKLRAFVADAAGHPLPLGAAYADLGQQRELPAASAVVRLLLDHARTYARRNVEALRAALGGDGGAS